VPAWRRASDFLSLRGKPGTSIKSEYGPATAFLVSLRSKNKSPTPARGLRGESQRQLERFIISIGAGEISGDDDFA
jgi:hypothetical protein